MEIVLALTILVLAIIAAVQSATIPFLWWKAMKHEEKIDKLDQFAEEVSKLGGFGQGPDDKPGEGKQ